MENTDITELSSATLLNATTFSIPQPTPVAVTPPDVQVDMRWLVSEMANVTAQIDDLNTYYSKLEAMQAKGTSLGASA